MSVKVYDVPGVNLTAGATTQDFVLNSHPVMAASDTRSSWSCSKRWNAAASSRPCTHTASTIGRIGFAARSNPLVAPRHPVWSARRTSYGRAGGEIHGAALRAGVSAAAGAADRRLSPSGAADGDWRPRRLASTSWSSSNRTVSGRRSKTPWSNGRRAIRRTVRLREFGSLRSASTIRAPACVEETSFNPWHALNEHRPLGSMNRARREIYQAMTDFRRLGR